MTVSAIRRAGAIFTRGIAPLDAQALGFYRVCFAIGLWWVLRDVTMVDWPAPGVTHPSNAWLADWEWVQSIANRPELVVSLERVVYGAIALFGIGLWTRSSYVVIVLSLTLWTLVRLQHTGTHPWAVLLVTLWGLLTVRWGDGLSLDRVISHWRGRCLSENRAGRDYGFAVWMPGLVFGTAMFGAAYAKFWVSGVEWILSGAVKYHFVTDAQSAPVDWGLWIASHHWAAVGVSAFGIATEATLVAAVFFRPGWFRAIIGGAGCGLLLGFYLFQNEVWWAWWMLWACFFTPWSSIWTIVTKWCRVFKVPLPLPSSAPSPAAERPLTNAQTVAIGAICSVQLIASALQIEQQPFMSNYPMYSKTYPSTDVFDAGSPMHAPIRFMSVTSAGEQDVTQSLERTDLDGPLRDYLTELSEGKALTGEMVERLRWISDSFHERSGTRLGVVTLMRDVRAFDWTAGEVRSSGMSPVLTFDTNTMHVVNTHDEN